MTFILKRREKKHNDWDQNRGKREEKIRNWNNGATSKRVFKLVAS